MIQMMKITFPGGEKVFAHYDNFVIQTDQPVVEGGEGSAPSPFDLFIASIGTCIGYYVLKFCKQREIPYEDIVLHLNEEWNPELR
ncbi:MAG TPA: osmotically inducible protein OsmC, partial [Thermoplasmatales archaeon]|nr:osmotically inducible protein OsmC [Thermoplasmatales archaeon]